MRDTACKITKQYIWLLNLHLIHCFGKRTKSGPDHFLQRPKEGIWEVVPLVPLPTIALVWLQVLGLLIWIRRHSAHENRHVMRRLRRLQEQIVRDRQQLHLLLLSVQPSFFLQFSRRALLKALSCKNYKMPPWKFEKLELIQRN